MDSGFTIHWPMKSGGYIEISGPRKLSEWEYDLFTEKIWGLLKLGIVRDEAEGYDPIYLGA